jgi:hypothetical protein
MVKTLFVFGNSAAGAAKMSCESTTKSASLPLAIVPFSFSANSAKAASCILLSV